MNAARDDLGRPGVTLERAWEVCRRLDRADEQHARRDVSAALALTAPTVEDLDGYDQGLGVLSRGRMGR